MGKNGVKGIDSTVQRCHHNNKQEEKMKKVIAGAIMYILYSTFLFAQGPDTLWTKIYGGPVSSREDEAQSVQQTTDGGYIIVGYTSLDYYDVDVYLLKTDANGDTLWTRHYGGGTGYDLGYSVQQTTDGGYIITGWVMSGGGDYDVWLLKTDANGNLLWSKSYDGPRPGAGVDYGYSVQQTTDGGYIIVGETYLGYGAGVFDVWLLKTDANGDTLWTRRYGGPKDDAGYSVQQTTDGGYIIAGYTLDASWVYNVWLLKTNGKGDTLWTKTYGTMLDFGQSVQQTTDGGYIIVGYTMNASWNFDVWLLKTDAMGDTLWTKSYGGAATDYGYSVQQTTDGGYIITGKTDSFGAGIFDAYLVKTDANGNTLWSKTYGGTEDDEGWSVRQTTDGGYIIAGCTKSFGAGDNDVYLIKLEGITIQATIDIDPSVLNDKSQGRWVTCYIELPEGYSAEDIDATTVEMTEANGEAFDPPLPSEGPFGVGDYDEDGIPDLMVKFDRQELILQLTQMGIMSYVELTVLGELYDDTEFEGFDTILFLRHAQKLYGQQALREFPLDFMIVGCEPNPFRTRTTITYAIPTLTDVTLSIYDVNGRLVNVLVDEYLHPGYHTLSWDGINEHGEIVPNGVYFLRFETDEYKATQKLLFVK